MDIFIPPPGLPEERARAWVHRHRRRARRERRRAALRKRGMALGVLLTAALCILGMTGTAGPGPAPVEVEPTPTVEAQLVELIFPLEIQSAPATPPVRFVPEVPLEPELQEALWQACDQYAVPYEVALGVAETESHFDLDADNGSCFGVMQINSVNFDWLKERGIDPTTYEGNLQAGVLMLGQHMGAYKDWHKALMAYNCGADGASKLWSQGYTSSRYSRAVMLAAENWKTILNNNKEAINNGKTAS